MKIFRGGVCVRSDHNLTEKLTIFFKIQNLIDRDIMARLNKYSQIFFFINQQINSTKYLHSKTALSLCVGILGNDCKLLGLIWY